MSMQEIVMAVVCEHCELQRFSYAPEMIINGRPGFSGEEAEDLVYAAAERIGLAREEVDRFFPYDTYFEPETSLSLWPFQLIQWLFRSPPTYQPLTAEKFADLLAMLKQEAHHLVL